MRSFFPLQALIFASKAPISVVFVGVGRGDLSELERLGKAGTRLAFQGRKIDRDILQVLLLYSNSFKQFVNLTLIRNEMETEDEAKAELAERALYQVPTQFAAFMMRQNIVPNGLARDRPVSFSILLSFIEADGADSAADYAPSSTSDATNFLLPF